jgi:hypothetical protein
MANESMSGLTSVEISPDVVLQTPAIEIGYLTSIAPIILNETTVQNPAIEIGYLTSLSSVEGVNNITIISDRKKLIIGNSKTLLGKIIII